MSSEPEGNASLVPFDAPLSDDAELPAGTLIDHFQVRGLIGSGGMGRVYAARDLRLGRRVALKVIRRELLGRQEFGRFLEEARLTARFSHPHIVIVYAVGETQGRPYVALEYLEGESLRARLRQGPFAPREAVRAARAIAEALAEAHRHGIIHADLKPENVILARDGRLRVVDFGLARSIGAGPAGQLCGTPAYMAPELWRGEAPSPAIDVWALGLTVCEMLEGRRPLGDHGGVAIAYRPSQVPLPEMLRTAPIGGLLASCFELDPYARPSAASIAEQLGRWIDGGDDAVQALDAPPFRGLAPFTESDARDYFGRAAEVEAFLERARGQALLPVVGPSGIGKSSFVQAGVLPRMREGGPWTLLRCRPGAAPFESLAAQLAVFLFPSGSSAPELRELNDRLRSSPGALGLELRALADRTSSRVMLVLDQLEELYTLTAEADADQFADALAMAADDPADPVRVIFTLREDYLARCARSAGLRRALSGLTVLAPLTRRDLEETITRPLARAGYRFDDVSLTARIAMEVEGLAAGLPLLQFACRTLWDRRDRERRVLRSKDYLAMGGVAGALAEHAKAVLAQLDEHGHALARVMLLRLVAPDGTRRPRTRTEVLADLPESAGVILDRLTTSRLLSSHRAEKTGQTVLELAHESLSETWPDLARWLDETREDRALFQQLEQASALWESRGCREDETWSGDALRDALRRGERLAAQLPPRVRAFIDAGEARSRRLRSRRRWISTAAVSVLFVATVTATVAAFAFREKELEAVRQRAEINLAAADMGRFELVLAPFDWEPESLTERPVDARDLALAYTLHAPSREDPDRPGRPLGPSEAVESQREISPAGELVLTIEARSGPTFVEISGRGAAGERCSPSWVPLQRLPGYAERGEAQKALRLWVPTCRATRAGMVLIPGGPYYRGGAGDPPVALPEGALEPERPIEVPDYWLDRTEVTNAAYAIFARMEQLTGERMPRYPEEKHFQFAGDPRAPVTGLSAHSAEAYCRFLGKTLPSEDEWKKALRGGVWLDAERKVANPRPHRSVPWDRPGEVGANLSGAEDGFLGVAPVGSFRLDRSPYGIFDLAGNVAEWTSSAPRDEGLGMLRTIQGSDWDTAESLGHHSASFSNSADPRYFSFATGLRCRLARPPEG